MFGNYMGRRPDPFKNMMVFSLILLRRHSIKPVPGRRPVTVWKKLEGKGVKKRRGFFPEKRREVCPFRG